MSSQGIQFPGWPSRDLVNPLPAGWDVVPYVTEDSEPVTPEPPVDPTPPAPEEGDGQ